MAILKTESSYNNQSFLSIWLVAVIILYSWLALSGDYADAYNGKVILSSYLIVGDKASIDDLSFDDNINYDRAHLVAIVELLEPSFRDENARTKRIVATAFGETDLRYHLKLKSRDFIPTTFDFSSNALYNYSYIINTPTKLIHNIKADISVEKLVANAGSKAEIVSKLDKIHGKMVSWIFIIWDILHAFTGAILAFFMFFIGSLIGLLFHPLQSFSNFFPSIWEAFVTTWHAILYLKYLFR